MSTNVKDFDEVRAVIQLYVDGSNGDVEKPQRAFHPAARMAGRFGAELDDNTPIADYISWFAAQPVLAGPEFRSAPPRLVHIAVSGQGLLVRAIVIAACPTGTAA